MSRGYVPLVRVAATLSGMRKKLIALVGAGLLLTGCSASTADAATTACVKEAEAEVGQSIKTDALTSANMGDALYEAGITDERETDDKNAMFTVSGDVTYMDGSKEIRKAMVCTVTFKDGSVSETNLNLS